MNATDATCKEFDVSYWDGGRVYIEIHYTLTGDTEVIVKYLLVLNISD